VTALTKKERRQAREIAVDAAMLGFRHRSAIHYTQGSSRWQGISDTRYSRRDQYPNYADCSAFATWCLWNAMAVNFHRVDTVNGLRWKAGNTATMAVRSRRIEKVSNVLRADLVIYGRPGVSAHVAIVVGRQNGVPIVVSHGSEAGPLLLPYNYRRDIYSIRRYIHKGV